MLRSEGIHVSLPLHILKLYVGDCVELVLFEIRFLEKYEWGKKAVSSIIYPSFTLFPLKYSSESTMAADTAYKHLHHCPKKNNCS